MRRTTRPDRAVPPGRQARRLALTFAVLALLISALAAATWQRDADLRDLDRLARATAAVTGWDSHRRGPDDLQVEFTPADGGRLRADVPYSGAARAGDDVLVAYRADDPSRVRTVEDWSPGYVTWSVYAVVLAAVALVAGAFGLVSGWRRSRWESDEPVGELPVEALGRRVVRGSLAVQAIVGLAGLVVAAGCAVGVVRSEGGDRVGFTVGVALGLVLGAGAVVLVHRWAGRDGVWVTGDALVARRRGRVRSWPWAQVVALGVVLDRGTATVAAARLDDGLDDGIGEDGWVTLARPLAGPFAAHTWLTRFRRLADEHGLPFAEGLAGNDLADGLASTYVRRRSARGTPRDRAR